MTIANVIFRIVACIGAALGIMNMLLILYDRRMFHLKQQIRNLHAKIEVDSNPTLEEMYHAGWAVIIYRTQQGGDLSEAEMQILRRLRSALEPVQKRIHICNPYDTTPDILGGPDETQAERKYLVRLWFADHSAVVIDQTPEDAVRRAQLYEPNGGWEHASIEVIARVRASLTSRVLAFERLNGVA